MCNGAAVRAFQADAIARLIEIGAHPVVLICDARSSPAQPKLSRLVRRISAPNFLWRLYTYREPSSLRMQSLDPRLSSLPRIDCVPATRGRFSEYFSDEDVAAIAKYDLDFILRCGFNIIRGDVLRAARYGVWSFHHGDETRYRGGPPGFWEIYEGNPVSGAILQRLTDRLDAGVILKRGYFKTCNYSYARNLNTLLDESAEWPARVVAAVRAGIDIQALPHSASTSRVYVRPSNLQMLRYFARLGRNIIARIIERGTREEWNVGIVRQSVDEVVRGARARNVNWVPPIPDGWLADPMAVAADGAIAVLCERMNLGTEKADIAAMEYSNERWSAHSTVIRTGCHASYPFIFAYDGQTYCVPETFEANEVRLYRARAFAKEWELVGTLLQDVPAVDSTVFEYGGLWWLFCTSAGHSGHRLEAYYAPGPFGPWLPHAENPIKIDIRSSRPAGSPFWHRNSFYRPAQDCSRTYGGRIAINRVIDLTPKRFSEEVVSHFEPDPRERYGLALHTLSMVNGYCIIDGKRRVRATRGR